MVVLEEVLSGFAIRKPPKDCERLRSPSMASRPRRMWLRPSPFRDPGPTARPRLEVGGATVRSVSAYSGVTTVSRPWKSRADALSERTDTGWLGPSSILAKVTAQCGAGQRNTYAAAVVLEVPDSAVTESRTWQEALYLRVPCDTTVHWR